MLKKITKTVALVGALSFAAVPFAANAQNEDATQPPKAPSPSGGGGGGGAMMKKGGAMKGGAMKGGAMANKKGGMMMKKGHGKKM